MPTCTVKTVFSCAVGTGMDVDVQGAELEAGVIGHLGAEVDGAPWTAHTTPESYCVRSVHPIHVEEDQGFNPMGGGDDDVDTFLSAMWGTGLCIPTLPDTTVFDLASQPRSQDGANAHLFLLPKVFAEQTCSQVSNDTILIEGEQHLGDLVYVILCAVLGSKLRNVKIVLRDVVIKLKSSARSKLDAETLLAQPGVPAIMASLNALVAHKTTGATVTLQVEASKHIQEATTQTAPVPVLFAALASTYQQGLDGDTDIGNTLTVLLHTTYITVGDATSTKVITAASVARHPLFGVLATVGDAETISVLRAALVLGDDPHPARLQLSMPADVAGNVLGALVVAGGVRLDSLFLSLTPAGSGQEIKIADPSPGMSSISIVDFRGSSLPDAQLSAVLGVLLDTTRKQGAPVLTMVRLCGTLAGSACIRLLKRMTCCPEPAGASPGAAATPVWIRHMDLRNTPLWSVLVTGESAPETHGRAWLRKLADGGLKVCSLAENGLAALCKAEGGTPAVTVSPKPAAVLESAEHREWDSCTVVLQPSGAATTGPVVAFREMTGSSGTTSLSVLPYVVQHTEGAGPAMLDLGFNDDWWRNVIAVGIKRIKEPAEDGSAPQYNLVEDTLSVWYGSGQINVLGVSAQTMPRPRPGDTLRLEVVDKGSGMLCIYQNGHQVYSMSGIHKRFPKWTFFVSAWPYYVYTLQHPELLLEAEPPTAEQQEKAVKTERTYQQRVFVSHVSDLGARDALVHMMHHANSGQGADIILGSSGSSVSGYPTKADIAALH